MAVFGDKAARTRIEFSPSSNTQLALALSLGADQGRNEVRPKQVAPHGRQRGARNHDPGENPVRQKQFGD
jgi:hypothetical protein